MILIGAVGPHADGVRISRIGYVCDVVLGHVDGGEELHAVAHRDAILVLGVVGLDVIDALSRQIERQEQDQEHGTTHRNLLFVGHAAGVPSGAGTLAACPTTNSRDRWFQT